MRVGRKVEEVPLIFLIEVTDKTSGNFVKLKNFERFWGVLVSQNFEFFEYIFTIFFGFAKFVFYSSKVF